ncbi:MAG: hypothetical protein MUF77_02755 [Leptospira sp.]|jgi:hypothetical protein|nr:hypothetical protein [Leptospira sp.]
MKKILILISIFITNTIASQSLADAKEIQAATKKMCEKTSACMKEKMKDLPAEQKKMFEAQFVNGNVCQSRYAHLVPEGGKPVKSEKPQRKLTKEEIENIKKCANEMAKMSCADLEEGNMPSSCEGFQE